MKQNRGLRPARLLQINSQFLRRWHHNRRFIEANAKLLRRRNLHLAGLLWLRFRLRLHCNGLRFRLRLNHLSRWLVRLHLLRLRRVVRSWRSVAVTVAVGLTEVDRRTADRAAARRCSPGSGAAGDEREP